MIMKTFLLIFFGLFIITSFSQDFAPVGAKWHYSSHNGGLAPSESEFILVESVKDTNCYGKNCMKIERSHYKYSGDTLIYDPLFIYESNDTVYIYNDIFNKFTALYIFNISVGDTIEIYAVDPMYYYPGDSIAQLVIDSITTVIIGGENLKRVFLHGIGNAVHWNWGYNGIAPGYTEKLGGHDLFLPIGLTIPEQDGPLRCYEDSLIFVNFSTVQCDHRIINRINNLESNSQIIIYPNPASKKLNIKSNNEILIRIYDSVSNLILETNNKEINTESFSSGMYYIQVLENGINIKTEKIIIK